MEDIVMFVQKGSFSSVGRAATLAAVAAVLLTTAAPSLAVAAPGKGRPALAATHQATDFSSRGRVYRGGRGGGAAAAAFAGIVGTGIAIAAAQNRYNDSYAYYDGGPAPTYYGGGPYYGGHAYYGGYYGRSAVPRFHGHPLANW
jgi:hypothetical protein